MATVVDEITQDRIRTKADEIAVEKYGCRFDKDRANHVCDFIENNLVLYEGEYAGQPFKLLPWQREALEHIFGWVVYSEDWGREIRRFQKAQVWVPKKNGKSPLAASVGLYLLLGDGENGQKVFSAARDGGQAKIVHTHAIQMLKRSPTFGDAIGKTGRAPIQVFANTGKILWHEPHNTYEILSGDNARSQEGLNGSVVIDEAHVVDAKLARTLEYMGASRAEPLEFRASTAGDDLEGWGGQQYTYGEAVNKGDVEDPGFFHMSYHADAGQPEEFYEDEQVWRDANPSLGTTIRMGEFRGAFTRAKQQGLQAWREFLKYRLNVWMSGSGHWLRRGDWDTCRRDKPLEDFHGLKVGLGLDLAHVGDFASLVLNFRLGQDEYFQFPFIWTTEAWTFSFEHVADFQQWGKDGHIIIQPGKQIDQDFIFQKILEVNELFNVVGMAFDPWKSANICRKLEDELDWTEDNGKLLPFGQTITNFAAPTGEYERLVINDGLHHPNNRALNWMASHCGVKVDPNLNKRPIKTDDARKIDGIVAGIMALWVSWNEEPEDVADYYETNEVEFY